MQLPCKENKCLLLPVCKTKAKIICPDLKDYANYLKLKFIQEKYHDPEHQMWTHLSRIFPHIEVLGYTDQTAKFSYHQMVRNYLFRYGEKLLIPKGE